MNTLFSGAMALLMSLIPASALNNVDSQVQADAQVRQNYNLVQTENTDGTNSRINNGGEYYGYGNANGRRSSDRQSDRSATNSTVNTNRRNAGGQRVNDSNRTVNPTTPTREENRAPISGIVPRIRADVYIYLDSGAQDTLYGYGLTSNDSNRSWANSASDKRWNVGAYDDYAKIPQTLEMRNNDYYTTPEYPNRKNMQAWGGNNAKIPNQTEYNYAR